MSEEKKWSTDYVADFKIPDTTIRTWVCPKCRLLYFTETGIQCRLCFSSLEPVIVKPPDTEWPK